jgi:hypothetical protein
MPKKKTTTQLDAEIRAKLAKHNIAGLLRAARHDPRVADPARDALLLLGYTPKRVDQALKPYEKKAPKPKDRWSEWNETSAYGAWRSGARGRFAEVSDGSLTYTMRTKERSAERMLERFASTADYDGDIKLKGRIVKLDDAGEDEVDSAAHRYRV